MKLTTATLLSALTCYTELAAAAATGRVITLDPSLSSHKHSSTHQALDEEKINAINAHGLQTSRLSKDNTERVFILAFVDEEDAEGTLGQYSMSRGATTY